MGSDHQTEFTGGVLMCSCGWRDRHLYFSYEEMERAAKTHREANR